jgi:predicted Zn finger-like uncharacterized protein
VKQDKGLDILNFKSTKKCRTHSQSAGKKQMRLICPNCDAQYEVDDSAIAEEGRDVQCSNCGHGWFQLPVHNEAEADAERPVLPNPARSAAPIAAKAAPEARAKEKDARTIWDDDDDEDDDDEAAVTKAPPSARKVEAAKAPVATPPTRPAPPLASPKPASAVDQPPQPAVPRRTMDESLLAVLREEAERETAVRRSETPRPLESQPDLGLEETTGAASAAKAVRERLSRLRGPEPEPETSDKPAARRDLLPDIEEINSTLRASTENRSGEAFSTVQAEAAKPEADTGFRSGFSLMLLIAVLLIVAYLAAPKISEQFPASKAALDSYVVAVDAARVWMDAAMRNAIAALQNLTGSQQN